MFLTGASPTTASALPSKLVQKVLRKVESIRDRAVLNDYTRKTKKAEITNRKSMKAARENHTFTEAIADRVAVGDTVSKKEIRKLKRGTARSHRAIARSDRAMKAMKNAQARYEQVETRKR